MSNEIDLLKRRIDRERAARQEAEAILEQKAVQLYLANSDLQHLNAVLEQTVNERTRELRTEQTRLRALITNLDSGILLESESRHIVLVNDFFCQLFGIPVPPAAPGRNGLLAIRRTVKNDVYAAGTICGPHRRAAGGTQDL